MGVGDRWETLLPRFTNKEKDPVWRSVNSMPEQTHPAHWFWPSPSAHEEGGKFSLTDYMWGFWKLCFGFIVHAPFLPC